MKNNNYYPFFAVLEPSFQMATSSGLSVKGLASKGAQQSNFDSEVVVTDADDSMGYISDLSYNSELSTIYIACKIL